MRSPRWPAWFIFPSQIVLLACLMRSPPLCSATPPIGRPKDSPAVTALKPDSWIERRELTASDGARNDEFGNSVAMSAQTALIGAWGKHSLYMPGAPMTGVAPQGAAYVFTCSGTPCTWTQQQELTAVDGASGDEFGNTVAVSGKTALIGAPYKNSYQGAAYVFT